MTVDSSPPASAADKPAVPRKVSAYNYRCVAFAAIASIVIGYCLSAVATTLGQPSFYEYMHLQQDKAADPAGYAHMVVIQGLTSSLSQAGAFFGSLFTSWTADRWGRMRSFQIGCAITIVGCAIQAGATNIPVFLVFRFVGGFGVGMLQVLFPMYAAELSPPTNRGFLVGQNGAFLCIGYNLAAAVSFGCYFAENGDFAWRFPLALQCLFPLVLLSFSFWMPESPRWLILKDRHDEARTVVVRVHSSPDDENDDFALAEFDLMVAQIEFERVKSGGAVLTFWGRWRYLFSKRSHLHRAALGFVVMFGMQLTGTTVINNYQIILYPGLGVGPALSLGLYWVYLVVAFCSNTTSSLIVDRLGRRKSFLIGLIGLETALIGETIMSSFLPTTNKVVLGFGVFFIFWFIPWYGATIDGVMYTYASEIWPSEIRSEGIALSMTGLWLSTITVLQASTTGFANCGYKFYLLFVCGSAAMWFVVYFFFPETGNIPMEEMGRLFGDEVVGTLDEKLGEHHAHAKHDEAGAGGEQAAVAAEVKGM